MCAIASRTRASGVAAESLRSAGESRSNPSSRPTPESCSARTWRQSSAVSPTPAESICSSSMSRWASSLTNCVSWSSEAVAMPRTSLGSSASSQRVRSFTRNVPPRNVASVCSSSRAVTICGTAWPTRRRREVAAAHLGARVLRVLPGELLEAGATPRRRLSQYALRLPLLLLFHHGHRARGHANQDVLEQADGARPIRRVRVVRRHPATAGEELLVVVLPFELYHEWPFRRQREGGIVQVAPAAQCRSEHGVVEVDVRDAGEHVGPHREARPPPDQAR